MHMNTHMVMKHEERQEEEGEKIGLFCYQWGVELKLSL